MVREIRNAGYFPTGAACTTVPNTNGVIAAGAQNFQFVLDANGLNGCADANENITYAFSTAGCAPGFGNITRTDNNTPPATPQPITNCNIPSPGGVPGNNFLLTYFAQNSTVAMNPIVLANIQRVLISLTVQSASPDTEFGGGQLNATMASNADLRNRGLPPPP